jgi:hypothetical protein
MPFISGARPHTSLRNPSVDLRRQRPSGRSIEDCSTEKAHLPGERLLFHIASGLDCRSTTRAIDLDEGTCSIDLVESVADFFGLTLPAARDIIREVGAAIANWRTVAAAIIARPSEINRMASAFEHEDLKKACAM